MQKDSPLLQTLSLSKTFGEIEAVKAVNLTVYPGQIVGLLGPNGAGKSTIIKMLSTLVPPTSGSAHLAGYDILKHPYLVRQQIGIIFQDPSLDIRLTGQENLEFHCMVYKVPKKDRSARIRRVLEMVDLTDAAHRIVKQYSGGMKRRLEIARGLLHQPKVLFLDEPTVGLDPQTRATIWSYIISLVQRHNMGVLMTTHYMEEAENCHYISIIDHGKIIAEGSPARLKSEIMDGDTVYLETEDCMKTSEWLRSEKGIPAKPAGNGLSFILVNADEQLAGLINAIPVKITRLYLKQPTLEDVFIQLTGRQIREEDPSHDQMRQAARKRGKL